VHLCRVRYFLAVCETGSFTAAARACNVTQPSVTTGVRRLERAVGGKLFERRHPVRLTPLGIALAPLLARLQTTADEIAALAAERGIAARKRRRDAIEIEESAGLLGGAPAAAKLATKQASEPELAITIEGRDKTALS